jgi:formylglycine-generating enzyme required for sulfatase activity/serine/threonine protein kinase/outer membrane biosynthesis protein TonB
MSTSENPSDLSKCSYTADDVFNYSEDLAESISNPEMEQHVKSCAKCRDILNGFRRVTDAAKHLRSEPAAKARMTKSKSDKPPGSIGGFRILTEIAEGGMGKVYKAYDAPLDRFLALKVMKDELSENARFCDRFMAEAKTLAKLNHPNVVVGHTVGRHEGQLFIAMEFIDGPSLLDKINKRQFTISTAIQTFLQILEGIKAAHEQQIIHRDIKPANIMVTDGGLIKILDFGLAKEELLGSPAAAMETGMLLGTLAYMAPEVAMGQKATKQSDIFALGVVLYQMLTNCIPFIDSPSPFALIERIKSEPLRPPSELNPAIPKALEPIILKMCAKRPGDRYPTVDAVMRAITAQPIQESIKQTPLHNTPWLESRGESKFYFCEACGKRVTDADLESGAGRDKKRKGVYCSLCAVGVMTVEFNAPAEAPARSAGSTAASPAPGPGTRRPGSARTMALSSEKLIDRAQHTNKAARHRPQSSPTLAVVGGIGALTAIVLVFVFNSKRHGDSDAKPLVQVSEAPKIAAVSQPEPGPQPARLPELAPQNPPLIKQKAEPVRSTAPDPEPAKVSGALPVVEPQRPVEKPVAVTVPSPPPAVIEKKNEPEKSAEVKTPAPPDVAAAVPNKEAQNQFAAVLKELTPLLNRNRFSDADKMLDDRIRDPAFTDAGALLKKEKSDLAEMRLLRQQAVDALKQKKGTVTLRIRGITMSGSVKDEPNRTDLSLVVRDGPEMSIKADQLDAQDVDTFAPAETGSAKAQDQWRRGLVFLAAGNTAKAEDYFSKARDGGWGDAVRYMDRLASVKTAAREALAQESWKKAEALFGYKNWKGAKQAYASFQTDFGSSETLQVNADALKKRLDAIDDALSPPKTPSLDLGGGIKIDLVLISPGEFMMGSEEGEAVEKPVHKVKITQAFYIAKFPVTQAQYQKVMLKNPSEFKGENLPVEMVKFTDAEEFCKKAAAATGKAMRLPTEAEWEYACRAGTSTRYYTGDHGPDVEPAVWHKGNSGGKTHAVGEKKPNAWGLYDMEGNVWEWCRDWFDGEYYAKSPLEDPTGAAQGTVRALRGGAWRCDAWDCRSSARIGGNTDATLSYIGFRVVVRVTRSP